MSTSEEIVTKRKEKKANRLLKWSITMPVTQTSLISGKSYKSYITIGYWLFLKKRSWQSEIFNKMHLFLNLETFDNCWLLKNCLLKKDYFTCDCLQIRIFLSWSNSDCYCEFVVISDCLDLLFWFQYSSYDFYFYSFYLSLFLSMQQFLVYL